MLEEIRGYNKNINFHFVEGDTLLQIQDSLKGISDKDTIVIFTFYIVDNTGTVYESLEHTTKAVADSCSVPIYGLWSFSFGHGIVGGKLVSGYSQGAKAVELMIDYIEGRHFENDGYFDTSDTNTYMYDYEVLTKYGLNIDLLPKESIIN